MISSAAGVLKVAGLVGAGYAAITGGLYVLQDSLVFPGTMRPSVPFEGVPRPERLDLTAADGVRLHGLAFPVAGADDLVLAFGGNAQDAEGLAADLLTRIHDRHLVVFHYRGYGRSEGKPAEDALIRDAVEIHDLVQARYQPERVFGVGISLGSGVATQLSRRRPMAGLLLVTPFDSILAIARERYGWLPVTRLLKHRFDNVAALAGNTTPVAVILAEDDKVVRPARSRTLIRATPNLVYERTIEEAGHNSIHGDPAYHEAFREALAALGRAGQPLSGPARAEMESGR